MFKYSLRDVKVATKHCNRGDMVALQVAAHHDLPRLVAYRYHMYFDSTELSLFRHTLHYSALSKSTWTTMRYREFYHLPRNKNTEL
jgi:hypothetical protein